MPGPGPGPDCLICAEVVPTVLYVPSSLDSGRPHKGSLVGPLIHVNCLLRGVFGNEVRVRVHRPLIRTRLGTKCTIKVSTALF